MKWYGVEYQQEHGLLQRVKDLAVGVEKHC